MIWIANIVKLCKSANLIRQNKQDKPRREAGLICKSYVIFLGEVVSARESRLSRGRA